MADPIVSSIANPRPVLPATVSTAYVGPLPSAAPLAAPMAGESWVPTSQLSVLPIQAVSLPYQPSTVAPLGLLQGLFDALHSFVNWLLGRSPTPQPTTPANPQPTKRATEFVVSSFNVLGSSHTKPGAEKPNMASGPKRIHDAVALLDKHKVDVVGFQEFQPDQFKEFKKVAGDRFSVYPGLQLGSREVVNSIAWRKDKWDLVKGDTINIPYFNGQTRKMPVVLLRNKETGQQAYFANFHNPADTRRFTHQEKWRDKATDLEIALVNRLRKQTGLPVIVTGDMNEKAEYFDRMTRNTEMKAANGKHPKKMGIDWIFGSPDIQFSGYTSDRSDLVKRASDHPIIVSRAKVPPKSS